MLIDSSLCQNLLDKRCTFLSAILSLKLLPTKGKKTHQVLTACAFMCVCVFLRCPIQTLRRQRRLKSAAGGWRWTWGSLRCGATPSPFAAPPTQHHRRAHRVPAPTPAPWEVKLQKTNERFSNSQILHALLSELY